MRSHAASSGAPVEREVVRATMLLRLHTLATGRTGVRPSTAQAYAAMMNAGMTAFPPEAALESEHLPLSSNRHISPANVRPPREGRPLLFPLLEKQSWPMPMPPR